MLEYWIECDACSIASLKDINILTVSAWSKNANPTSIARKNPKECLWKMFMVVDNVFVCFACWINLRSLECKAGNRIFRNCEPFCLEKLPTQYYLLPLSQSPKSWNPPYPLSENHGNVLKCVTLAHSYLSRPFCSGKASNCLLLNGWNLGGRAGRPCSGLRI